MKLLHLVVLTTAVLVTSVSCAYVPHAPNNDATTATMRAQYLSDYPDGPYNEAIRKGELAKGMNVLEVLASWGPPDRRGWTQTRETWSYVSKDRFNADYIMYNLSFEQRVLERWQMMRNTAGVGGADAEGYTQPVTSTPVVYSPFRGGSVRK